jgi:hypothetical protein
LEGLTVGRGRRAIQDLLDLLPRTVAVRRGAEVAADQVVIGDTVVLKPGGRIPVEGFVLVEKPVTVPIGVAHPECMKIGEERCAGQKSTVSGTTNPWDSLISGA